MKFNEDYRLKKMAKLAMDSNKILDIGYAQMPNPFLKADQVIGFDLIKGKKLNNYSALMTGDVFDLPSPFESIEFDVVIAGEIIEHVNDPVLFVTKCASVLKTDGKLILSTPNPNSFIERILTLNLNRNFYYTEDHITLYPQRWLIRILEMGGFENVKLLSGGHQFPFWGLIPFPRPWCYQTISIAYKV